MIPRLKICSVVLFPAVKPVCSFRLFCLQGWQCLHDLLRRLSWSFPEICWRGWVRVDIPVGLLFGTSHQVMVWGLMFLWWSSRPWVPVFRWCTLQASKTLPRQMLMYFSVLAVFLSQSGTDQWRRPQSSVWKCFLIFWISQVGSHLGKARQKTAAWFPGHTCTRKLCYHWWCSRPTLARLFLKFLQIFEACKGITPPLCSSVPWSAGGAPNGCDTSKHSGDGRRSDSSFPMNN